MKGSTQIWLVSFPCCLLESSTAVSTGTADTIVLTGFAVLHFFLSLQEAEEKIVPFFIVLLKSPTPVASESA